MNVVVAGGTGAIGSAFVSLAREAGHRVRLLSRSRPARLSQQGAFGGDLEVFSGDALLPGALTGLADGGDVLVSALGAPVTLDLRCRASYEAVDIPANLNLLAEARRAGVPRFVYVAAATGPGWSDTRYMLAHEAVVQALLASGLEVSILRPTGVFSALDDFLGMARRGFAQVLGDGSARTNPIHPLDVAEALVAHLEGGPVDVPLGGPELLTRRQIAELAFEALGKTPRVMGTPAALPRLMASLIRPLHPRLGDLMAFATAVSTHDAVAPQVGTRRLADWFEARAAEERRGA